MKPLAIFALATMGVLAPIAAQAAPGFATANVNLRAGPSTQFPAVIVVPDGARLQVHGCLAARNWCDVSFRGLRGWVSNSYLYVSERGRRVEVRRWRAPVVTFEFNNYWNRHYRDRPFFRERDRWNRFDRDWCHRHPRY